MSALQDSNVVVKDEEEAMECFSSTLPETAGPMFDSFMVKKEEPTGDVKSDRPDEPITADFEQLEKTGFEVVVCQSTTDVASAVEYSSYDPLANGGVSYPPLPPLSDTGAIEVPKLSSSYRTLVPIPKHGRTKYLLVSSEGSKVNYQMKPIDTLADQHHLPKTTEREKKENCCEMETPAKKRIVVNPRTNWTKRETDQFLQLVVNLKDKFEKPTARLFYTQLAAKEPTLSSFYWTTMRDKMKNLRNKYKSAIAWRNNTGAGLDAEDKERTIRDNILKLCPQFDALEELFGERPSTSALPLFTFDSDDTASTDADVWIDSSLEVVLPLAEDEGVGSGVKSPATTLPTSSALPTASRTLQDQHATLGQPSSPPCSFSAFKRRKAKKPFSKQITKPTSSLAYLNQINLDLSEAIKYKADKEAETEDRRMQLEREKFQWQRRREERLLKLEEKRILEETRLKQQELNYEILLEKFRIEKELELKKIERKEYDNNKKQD